MIKVLDKGYVELQDIMGDDLAIVNAARISYLGESKGEGKDKKLLFYLYRNRHTSPFEMVEFKFRVKCPLFVSKQWMRHRNWNFNEASRRYTSENIEFYIPEEWRLQSTDNKQMSAGILTDSWDTRVIDEMVEEHTQNSLNLYNKMLSKGISREMARMVLPQNLYTEFIGKIDAHNLIHFIRLRTHEHAQQEIREYANILLDILTEQLPWTAEAYSKYG